MGTKAKKILKPKASGLTNKLKPLALVVKSPHDLETDAKKNAVKFKDSRDFVSDLGFGIANKAAIKFSESSDADFRRAIKPGKKVEITVWLESHGAPGWLFGADKSKESELEGTIGFVDFIRKLEEYTGATVNNIVLSGCFTANELINDDEYFISPARTLSYLLPDKNIVGFVGENAKAKVTNVFAKTSYGYEPKSVNPENASIIFKDGKAIETVSEELYCNHEYTPLFVLDGCRLDEALDEEDYYQPCAVLETIEQEELQVNPGSYGTAQLEQILEVLEAEAPQPEAPQPMA